MIFVLNRSKLTKRNICYGAKALVRFGAKRALAEPRGYFARGLNYTLAERLGLDYFWPLATQQAHGKTTFPSFW